MKKNSDNSPKTELRRQAEAKLSERKKKAVALPATELETQRLIHELEVHQIELEMQNEELAQSRAQVEAGLLQYTNLYDFAPIGYFTLACDGTIHQVNLAGASLLGIERSALVKRRFGAFVSTESRSVFNAFLEKVFGSQQKGTCEVTFQNNGSAPLWVHLEATISIVSRGESDACRVVVVDIAERKRGEKALQESEERFRQFFEYETNYCYRISTEGTILDLNPCALRALGYASKDELVGKPLVTTVYAPNSRDRARQLFLRWKETGELHNEELSIITKTGEERIIILNVSAVRDAEGKMLHSVSIQTDITERKSAEDALRESELKLRTVADFTNDWEYWEKENQEIAYISPSCERITGYSRQEFMADPTLFEKIVHPEDVDYVKRYRERVFTTEHKQDIDELEFRIIHKNGSVVHIFHVCRPIFDVSDKYQGRRISNRDITERKRAEEDLKKSEEKYRSIFENIQDVYYETLLDGKILEVSPSIEIISKGQYNRADLIGKSMYDFYPDTKDRDTLIATMQKKGSVTDFEVRLKNRDGSLIHCSISAKMIFNAEGRPEKIIGSMHDISERKQAEAALSESMKYLRASQQIAHLGHWHMNVATNHVVWSEELYKMYGFDLLLPPPPYTEHMKLFTPESWERLSTALANTRETGVAYELELVTLRKDGSNGWMWVRGEAEFDSEGKIVDLWGAAQDITERKQAEEEIIKLSNAVEQSSSSIAITNLKGEIEYVNPKFCEVTGYTIQESMGKNPRILKSGKTSSEEYKHLWDTITNGQVWRGEFHNKKKNGELYWESATISPIKDADGKTTHFLAVKEDITQQKTMAEELRQMQKLEGLGTLAGGIAHDFNNILGIILAYNSGIKKFKDDSKKLDLATETITKAVDRGKTLVQQILMFARKTETSFGAVNVNDVVMEIVNMVYEMFPKTVTCSQNFDKSIHYINADRSQLHQVLMNLCVNARDAMPKGGILAINTRMVSVASLRHQHPDATASSYVCIEVSDTGEGMTAETQKHIFEPFFTTKGIGKGTGLGLSVTFGVIQTHRGFIDVDSELGKGTTFRVYLPASEVAEPIRETEEKTLEEMPGGTETLLVIEDEEMLLMSLQMVLVDKGYNVISAQDGLTALKIYKEKKNKIALVITDLGLPNISGLEVCQQIKKINPKERIILATGFLDPEMKEEFLKAGIQNFLFKPYDLRKVLKVIREVLDGK